MGIDILTLNKAKKYTDETVVGGGAIKGKNCVITSIQKVGLDNIVNFQWTLDDGTILTDNLTIKDGENLEISKAVGNAITLKSDGLFVAEGAVKVSKAAENAIEIKADGIYVKAVSEVAISEEEGNIIEQKADGLYAKSDVVKISKEADNIIKQKTDGLYAKADEITISKKSDNVVSLENDGLYVPKTTVDDKYNGLSDNAQSGKAVAEAIASSEHLTKKIVTKSEIDAFIADPSSAKFNVFYMLKDDAATGTDKYLTYQRLGDETTSEFVCTGDTSVDLSDYAKADLSNLSSDGEDVIDTIINNNTSVIHNGDTAVYFNDVTISDDLQVKGTLFLGESDDKRSLDSILDDKVDVDSPSFTGTISTDKNISATNGKVSTKQIVGTKVAGTEGTPNYVTDRLDINGGATASSSSVTGMQINSGGSKLKVLSGTTEINATDELNLISADINISSTGTSGNKIEVRSQGEINIGSDDDVTISSHGKLVKITMDGARVKINNGRLECDHGARIDNYLEVGHLSGIGTSDYISLVGSGIALGNNSQYGFIARSTNNVSMSDGGKYDERGIVLGDLDNPLGFKSKFFVSLIFKSYTPKQEIYEAITQLVFPVRTKYPSAGSLDDQATTCIGYMDISLKQVPVRAIILRSGKAGTVADDIEIQYFNDIVSDYDDSNISTLRIKKSDTGTCPHSLVLFVPRVHYMSDINTFYSL